MALLNGCLYPDRKKEVEYSSLYRGREELIQRGKLLHFRQIEKALELPPGTVRALVVPVAERYGLVPSLLSDNVVRFQYTETDE